MFAYKKLMCFNDNICCMRDMTLSTSTVKGEKLWQL